MSTTRYASVPICSSRYGPHVLSPGARSLWDFDVWRSSLAFEEEMDLLRCHQDLLEAAEYGGGTTSDGTYRDFSDVCSGTDDDGYVPPRVLSMVEAVIEEDEDDEDDGDEVPHTDRAAHLWAQSLLRLKRAIDEIQCLCEFENNDSSVAEVQMLLEKTAENFKRLRAAPEQSPSAVNRTPKPCVETPNTERMAPARESVRGLAFGTRSPQAGTTAKAVVAPKKKAVAAVDKKIEKKPEVPKEGRKSGVDKKTDTCKDGTKVTGDKKMEKKSDGEKDGRKSVVVDKKKDNKNPINGKDGTPSVGDRKNEKKESVDKGGKKGVGEKKMDADKERMKMVGEKKNNEDNSGTKITVDKKNAKKDAQGKDGPLIAGECRTKNEKDENMDGKKDGGEKEHEKKNEAEKNETPMSDDSKNEKHEDENKDEKEDGAENAHKKKDEIGKNETSSAEDSENDKKENQSNDGKEDSGERAHEKKDEGRKNETPSAKDAKVRKKEDEPLIDVGPVGNEKKDGVSDNPEVLGIEAFDLNSVVQNMVAKRMLISKRIQAHTPKRGEDLRFFNEERHRRAEIRREGLKEQLTSHTKTVDARIEEARQRREQNNQRMQVELLEKMSNARRIYQEQLRTICQRARKENRKTAEVVYIQRENCVGDREGERESLERRHAKAFKSRSATREKMRRRLIQSAARIAAAADRRRTREEAWLTKVSEELRVKELQAEKRRSETMRVMKERSVAQENKLETLRCKKKLLQEEENTHANTFMKSRGKVMYRLGLDVEDLPEATKTEMSKVIMCSSPRVAEKTPSPKTKIGVKINSPKGRVSAVSPKQDKPMQQQQKEQPHQPMQKQTQHPRKKQGMAADASAKAVDDVDAVNDTDTTKVASDPEGAKPAHQADAVVIAKAATDGNRSNRPSLKASLSDLEAAGTAPSEHEISDNAAKAAKKRASNRRKGACRKKLAAAAGSGPTGTDFQPPPRRKFSANKMSPTQNERRAHLRELLEAQKVGDTEAVRMLEKTSVWERRSSEQPAYRARISKLVNDLKKSHEAHRRQPNQDITAIRELNKVLERSRREGDMLLMVSTGACAIVVDLMTQADFCSKSQLFMDCFKCIGLLTKHAICRQFFIVTNKVQNIVDCAINLLQVEVNDDDESATNVMFCLSQLFLTLGVIIKQNVPQGYAEFKHLQCEHIMLSGLSENLAARFNHAGTRAMRIYDASPLPLFLLRATEFLSNIVQAYHPESSPLLVQGTKDDKDNPERIAASVQNKEMAAMLQETEIFGLVALLSNIMLPDAPGKMQRDSMSTQDRRISQTALLLCLQVTRVLACVGRIDVNILQQTFGGTRMHEWSHLISCVVDYCATRTKVEGKEDVLHEVIQIIGFYILLSDNQDMMRMTQGASERTLLTKLAGLPLTYFVKGKLRDNLFPTLLCSIFRAPSNLEILKCDLNPSTLKKYIEKWMVKGDKDSSQSLSTRFPAALLPEMLEFIKNACGTVSSRP